MHPYSVILHTLCLYCPLTSPFVIFHLFPPQVEDHDLVVCVKWLSQIPSSQSHTTSLLDRLCLRWYFSHNCPPPSSMVFLMFHNLEERNRYYLTSAWRLSILWVGPIHYMVFIIYINVYLPTNEFPLPPLNHNIRIIFHKEKLDPSKWLISKPSLPWLRKYFIVKRFLILCRTSLLAL